LAEHEHNGTEAPTPRRRQMAREEGQVVQSPDLSSSLTLLTACLVFYAWGGTAGGKISGWMQMWFGSLRSPDWSSAHTEAAFRWGSIDVAQVCAPLLLSVMVIGLVIGFAQVGFVLSWKPLAVDFTRILPIKGWGKLFSMESGVRGGFALLKIAGVLTLASLLVWNRRAELSPQNFGTVAALVGFAWRLALQILMAIAAVSFCLAVTDYLIRWFRHEQKLKMTREEIKQEQKDDSGDPHLRAAIRKRQKEAMSSRSVAKVPEATVILTNPTHLAIALKYDSATMTAPQVVAKGAGIFAKNIVKIAKANGIPVRQRKPLARAIYKSVKVGQEIPFDFFRAVAEILMQIYKEKPTLSRK